MLCWWHGPERERSPLMDYRRVIAYGVLALLGLYLLALIFPYVIGGLACLGAWSLYKNHQRL